jgi:hypothetical protein
MLSPESSNSPEAAFKALEEGISICDRQVDGEVSLSIRRIGGSEELELSVFSLRGSFRCQRAELQRFLEHRPQKEQSSISKYRERFRCELQHLLPNGFGSLKLDFTACKRGRLFPEFSSTITKLCKHND